MSRESFLENLTQDFRDFRFCWCIALATPYFFFIQGVPNFSLCHAWDLRVVERRETWSNQSGACKNSRNYSASWKFSRLSISIPAVVNFQQLHQISNKTCSSAFCMFKCLWATQQLFFCCVFLPSTLKQALVRCEKSPNLSPLMLILMNFSFFFHFSYLSFLLHKKRMSAVFFWWLYTFFCVCAPFR